MPDGDDEADATGARGLSRRQTKARNRVIGAAMDLKLPEIETAATTIKKLSDNLGELQKKLSGFKSSDGRALQSSLEGITKAANAANAAVAGVGSGSGGAAAPSGTTGSNYVATATQQAAANANAVASRMPAGIANASRYFTGFENPAVGAAMGGLRYIRERLATNRNVTIASGGAFGMAARQQGVRVEDIMKGVSQFPGDVYGTPEDMLSLFSAAPGLGASYGFGGALTGDRGSRAGGQGVRAAGFFKGVSQAQMMNPGAPVSQIVQDIGGFAANSGAQRQAQMMTGGAFGMIAAGGRQKSLSEWAESILKWLQGLRPGSQRDRPFNYGELMAQYFPGSNIDAWFEANGVPQNMRTYWWTYALEKANKTGTTGGSEYQLQPDKSNVAWSRMRATSELTRTEFNFGAQMSGAYNLRERSNQWLNELMGTIQTNLAPAFSALAFLPDTIEDILMGLLESFVGAKYGGSQRAAPLETTADTGPIADVGDTGMYGATGGTGLAGLSPNMRSKLGPMMRANPRLRVNSGLRDNAMQKRLKAKGYSRVSGKPSAHTRGDAADLGPASEYGWLVANAGKFGLKSGNSQGEPWHVGVGDSSAYDAFSSILGGASSAGGLQDIVGALLAALIGPWSGLGGGGSAAGGITGAMSDTWFDDLVKGKSQAGFGGVLSGLPSLLGGLGGGGGGGGSSPGNGVASGSRRDLGVQAAKAAYAAGFRGEELVTAVAIAGRESSWNPNAYNGNAQTQDASYGLMQINMLGSLGPARRKAYGLQSNNELLDPYTNMRVAHEMYDDRAGQPFYPWGPYKGKPATYSTNVPEARDIVQSAFPGGYGDVETNYMMSAPPMRNSGGGIQFHNTFVIGNSSGGSGAGGIDVRRTVTMVADRLEEEMNRRAARSN